MPTVFTEHTDSPLEVITSADINAIQDAINNLESGWTAAPETWTYASATTFTIAGDFTAVYTVGTRLKMTNTTLKYFIVVSNSLSAGVTTVTITGGDDYALADATISGAYYSYEAGPPNFPDWFNYTPTGVAGANVALTGRFRVVGRQCEVFMAMVFTGAITFTTNPTLPIAASADLLAAYVATANLGVVGSAQYLDSGTGTVLRSCVVTVIASATVAVFWNATGATMAANSPITWANGDKYMGHFVYEI